ncbi:MAG: PilZ domain-containing protein [Deltaproteobacteria bacterium]|nr:PilZ domain-containing protein [Deltaproteobacteria bacterium]
MEHLVEAYLLIEQPRQRLGHWTQSLAALDSPMAPALAHVTALYDPTSDQALLALRYDEMALGPRRLQFVVEVALLAEVGMIQPAELSEVERRRFLTERLARCVLAVSTERSAVGALTELVRRVKEQRTAKPIRSVQPRGDTADPVLLVAAKGTRNDLERQAADAASPPPHKHIVARNNRLPTVEMDPKEGQRLVTETKIMDVEDNLPPAPPTKRLRAQSPNAASGSGPHLPTGQSEVIYARYLRSGRWVPVRVGSLSLKGAALLAGALPRVDDNVDVALTYEGHRALVRGAVGKVSSTGESRSTGATTFSVQFDLDEASRKQLVALLQAARAANVTIKPPPPRSTRRFPVEWPIALGTMRGAIKAEALDVSTAGMFVRPNVAIDLDSTLNFSLVLDDGGAPIAGRGKVVRKITADEATKCGLQAGYGITITDMADSERMRWLAFLARIERRADKRVLIGASPARLTELTQALAGCGYAVTGGTDPGALVQLAHNGARPADAALIDAGWLTNGASASWVENLFAARNVPCVTLQGDARRARMAVDRLLEVVV